MSCKCFEFRQQVPRNNTSSLVLFLSMTLMLGCGGSDSDPPPMTSPLVSSGGRVYTTTFPIDENPISEKGNWINGQQVGLAWSDVMTVAGIAIGTQSGTGQRGFDDSTAGLTGP